MPPEALATGASVTGGGAVLGRRVGSSYGVDVRVGDGERVGGRVVSTGRGEYVRVGVGDGVGDGVALGVGDGVRVGRRVGDGVVQSGPIAGGVHVGAGDSLGSWLSVGVGDSVGSWAAAGAHSSALSTRPHATATTDRTTRTPHPRTPVASMVGHR